MKSRLSEDGRAVKEAMLKAWTEVRDATDEALRRSMEGEEDSTVREEDAAS